MLAVPQEPHRSHDSAGAAFDTTADTLTAIAHAVSTDTAAVQEDVEGADDFLMNSIDLGLGSSLNPEEMELLRSAGADTTADTQLGAFGELPDNFGGGFNNLELASLSNQEDSAAAPEPGNSARASPSQKPAAGIGGLSGGGSSVWPPPTGGLIEGAAAVTSTAQQLPGGGGGGGGAMMQQQQQLYGAVGQQMLGEDAAQHHLSPASPLQLQPDGAAPASEHMVLNPVAAVYCEWRQEGPAQCPYTGLAGVSYCSPAAPAGSGGLSGGGSSVPPPTAGGMVEGAGAAAQQAQSGCWMPQTGTWSDSQAQQPGVAAPPDLCDWQHQHQQHQHPYQQHQHHQQHSFRLQQHEQYPPQPQSIPQVPQALSYQHLLAAEPAAAPSDPAQPPLQPQPQPQQLWHLSGGGRWPHPHPASNGLQHQQPPQLQPPQLQPPQLQVSGIQPLAPQLQPPQLQPPQLQAPAIFPPDSQQPQPPQLQPPHRPPHIGEHMDLLGRLVSAGKAGLRFWAAVLQDGDGGKSCTVSDLLLPAAASASGAAGAGGGSSNNAFAAAGSDGVSKGVRCLPVYATLPADLVRARYAPGSPTASTAFTYIGPARPATPDYTTGSGGYSKSAFHPFPCDVQLALCGVLGSSLLDGATAAVLAAHPQPLLPAAASSVAAAGGHGRGRAGGTGGADSGGGAAKGQWPPTPGLCYFLVKEYRTHCLDHHDMTNHKCTKNGHVTHSLHRLLVVRCVGVRPADACAGGAAGVEQGAAAGSAGAKGGKGGRRKGNTSGGDDGFGGQLVQVEAKRDGVVATFEFGKSWPCINVVQPPEQVPEAAGGHGLAVAVPPAAEEHEPAPAANGTVGSSNACRPASTCRARRVRQCVAPPSVAPPACAAAPAAAAGLADAAPGACEVAEAGTAAADVAAEVDEAEHRGSRRRLVPTSAAAAGASGDAAGSSGGGGGDSSSNAEALSQAMKDAARLDDCIRLFMQSEKATTTYFTILITKEFDEDLPRILNMRDGHPRGYGILNAIIHAALALEGLSSEQSTSAQEVAAIPPQPPQPKLPQPRVMSDGMQSKVVALFEELLERCGSDIGGGGASGGSDGSGTPGLGGQADRAKQLYLQKDFDWWDTVLHTCCRFGLVRVLHWLLPRLDGNALMASTKKRWVPLMTAARAEHGRAVEVTELLLRRCLELGLFEPSALEAGTSVLLCDLTPFNKYYRSVGARGVLDAAMERVWPDPSTRPRVREDVQDEEQLMSLMDGLSLGMGRLSLGRDMDTTE